jgi:hypothetical protein
MWVRIHQKNEHYIKLMTGLTILSDYMLEMRVYVLCLLVKHFYVFVDRCHNSVIKYINVLPKK